MDRADPRGYFLQVAASPDFGADVEGATEWRTVLYEGDLSLATEMAVAVERAMLEHRGQRFQSRIVTARTLDERVRRRLQRETENPPFAAYARTLRTVAMLELAFSLPSACGPKCGRD